MVAQKSQQQGLNAREVELLMPSIDELRTIADEVHELRPDWDVGGILTVLTEHRLREFELTRRAAITAARHPSSRTPAAISFGEHWATRPATTHGPQHAQPLPECSNCGQPARRHLGSCSTPRCADATHILRPPTTCPSCLAAWVPIVFVDDREEARRRAVPPNAEFRAACAAIFGNNTRGGEPTSLGDILAPAKRALDEFGDW